MKGRRSYLAVLTTIFLLAACGGRKDDRPERAERTTQQPSTPFDQSTAAEITGKVTFEGERPRLPVIHMDQDPVCVAKHSSPVYIEDGEVNANGTLPNVFVYIKEGAEKYSFATPTAPVILDQVGCMYKPHVLGIVVGQVLKVVNSDATTHNIHPMPKNNREWNESQPPGAAPLQKRFAHPEIMIPVKCNQHPWMRAYIGVTRNPLFAVTGRDGTFTIRGVPPGDYTLEAWTATFGTRTQKVTVAPNQTETVNFVFRSGGTH
jgi:plastocyanin